MSASQRDIGSGRIIGEPQGINMTAPRTPCRSSSRRLSDELRKWEKTFPDDLWLEFGRLTNWKGSVTQRSKYWGYLVTELVYDYLDRDVAQWLQENHPQPRDEKWHQWLTKHYGVQKLLQHIYILIGVARTCHSMQELKRKMAEMHNRIPVQYTLFIKSDAEPMP